MSKKVEKWLVLFFLLLVFISLLLILSTCIITWACSVSHILHKYLPKQFTKIKDQFHILLKWSYNNELLLFDAQSGGSTSIFINKNNGQLNKPTNNNEISFYQNKSHLLHPSLLPYIPKFYGVRSLNNHKKYSKAIIIENITKNMVQPTIVDIKIGVRHFSPICSDKKKNHKLLKTKKTTNYILGARMCGITYYDKNGEQHKKDKHYGRHLNCNEFKNELENIFIDSNKIMLNNIINDIENIIVGVMKCKGKRFFSASVLICKTKNRYSLKLIDFANFCDINELYSNDTDYNVLYRRYKTKKASGILKMQLNNELDDVNTPDCSLLFGLFGLKRILREIRDDSHKHRNRLEWIKFKNELQYSNIVVNVFNKINT